MEKGLRRAALDGAAQRLLAAIRLGQVELVEQEQADGQNGGDRNDGNDQAVEADAGGLHGDDFAVAIEHAEGDQHGDQYGQRRDRVEHAGGEVDEISADRGERNVIAKDVADQFEESEDQHQHDKAGQHQDEDVEEFANHVLIEDAGKRRRASSCGRRAAAGGRRTG